MSCRYTQSNAKFALSVDPDNQALQKRAALVNDLRKQVLAHLVLRLALCFVVLSMTVEHDYWIHTTIANPAVEM